MLKTLRRIVQEVNAAQNFTEALQIMVERVRNAMETQACSVFLIEPKKNDYILMATQGLNKETVGKLRVLKDEGLIGLVGRREEPINVEDARQHPDFYYLPEAGEEKYSAFLGVPIIHRRRLLGVMALQQDDARKFDENEVAFMVTISAQLGGVIASAEATGVLDTMGQSKKKKKTQKAKEKQATIQGIPSVPGVGIGQAVIVYPPADLDAVPDKVPEDIDKEIMDLKNALEAARNEINQLSERLADTLPPEEHALFDVYLKILDSESLRNEVIGKIRAGHWAQAALRIIIKDHLRQFEAMDDDYLSERASDVKDIGRRILSHLQASLHATVDYPEKTILVGDEVTAAALAEVPEGRLTGVVSARGSTNSHVAIVARALNVPTVMSAKGMSLSLISDKSVIVDGYHGNVFVSPAPALSKEYRILAAEEDELNAQMGALRDQTAETPDGHHLTLYVNTGLAMDAGLSLSVGAEGVGLYRSEVPFMTRDFFPTEEEQRKIYTQLLKAFAPRPVTMRTLDIGGDKALPYFPVKEENPFLGWRGIRITLDHPDVFLTQVRAMLRASSGLNNLRVMLPMVSGIDELDEAINLFEQAYHEVLEEGTEVIKPKLGTMIEVPSAVYQAREFAKRVDFLSVGSNDLTQYLLAVDRNNAHVAWLYDAMHPAVLQALMKVVEGAHSEAKHVSICGEMASDPVAVIVLLAMGFDSLSMNPASLPRVKWVVRNMAMSQARKLLGEVLVMETPSQIRTHLEIAIDEAGLGGLIRAGKS